MRLGKSNFWLQHNDQQRSGLTCAGQNVSSVVKKVALMASCMPWEQRLPSVKLHSYHNPILSRWNNNMMLVTLQSSDWLEICLWLFPDGLLSVFQDKLHYRLSTLCTIVILILSVQHDNLCLMLCSFLIFLPCSFCFTTFPLVNEILYLVLPIEGLSWCFLFTKGSSIDDLWWFLLQTVLQCCFSAPSAIV